MQSEAQLVTATAPALPDVPPDWTTVPDDLPCPRCGYNLRELPQSRCPECGIEFRWPEVLDAARNGAYRPLFEYQWRTRPVRSFLWTVTRLLVPWRFWGRIPITASPRVGGLLLQLVGTVVLVVGLKLTHAFIDHFICLLYIARRGRTSFAWRWPFDARECLSEIARTYLPAVLVLGLLTWLAMQVFWRTRKAYRVRQDLLLRVVVYALVSLMLLSTLLGIALALSYWGLRWMQTTPSWAYDVITWSDFWGGTVMLLWFYLCLGWGGTRHLQVRRGWAALVGLVFLLHAVVVAFAVIEVSQYCGTFDNVLARIIGGAYLPEFWRYW